MRALAASLALAAAASTHAAAQTGTMVETGAPAPLKCPLDRPYDPANPFARILRGERPASFVYADQAVVAFMPLDWEHPGHVLVVPRRAVRSLADMTDAETVAVVRLVRRVAAAQARALGATGYSLVQNNGRNQDVCHAHFHVIPNTSAVPRVTPSRGELDAMAARLKDALPPD